MKTKTSELTNTQLDLAVAMILQQQDPIHSRAPLGWFRKEYSSVWAHGGPIIEREKINIFNSGSLWVADMKDERDCDEHGPTPLIAAMRCYVASKLGDEVEIPEDY